jgi:type IV pilus assembly protein PilV
MLIMKRLNPSRRQTGFTLIEVLVAVLIVSIGLLGIVGLHSRAIQYSVGSEDVTRAMRLVDEAAWAIQNQGTLPLSDSAIAAWRARVRDPAVGFPYGDGTITPSDVADVARITITWRPPDLPDDAPPRRYTTEVGL